jgi:hypothetical protein
MIQIPPIPFFAKKKNTWVYFYHVSPENHILFHCMFFMLEVAITFGWKDLPRTIQLSTLLEPDDLAPLFAGAQWAGTQCLGNDSHTTMPFFANTKNTWVYF